MNEFLELLKQQLNPEVVQKGQELLEDILAIVNNNGEAGFVAGNLYFQLMTDELIEFNKEVEQENDEVDDA